MWVVDSPSFRLQIKNLDCNEDKTIPFNRSIKGKQWMQNKKYGPFVHASLKLNGKPFDKPQANHPDQKCKYTQMLLTSITEDDMMVTNSLIDNTNDSNFLTVNISIPTFQMALEPKRRSGVGMAETTTGRKREIQEISGTETLGTVINCSAQALLDSGCLIGDCMSQQIVDKLQATHLIVNTNTTICSGFNNEYSQNFPSLLIKISYFNERNLSLEVFETKVFILPKTPIDLIIGRKTIKQQRLTVTAPSNFEDQTNLTDNVEMTTEPFGDITHNIYGKKSQELYGATPLN
jgi:hypothetical protein